MQVYEIETFDGLENACGGFFLTHELARLFLERDGYKVLNSVVWEQVELDDDGEVGMRITAQIKQRAVVTALQQNVAGDAPRA